MCGGAEGVIVYICQFNVLNVYSRNIRVLGRFGAVPYT